jgi:hypothetical protein
MVIENPILLFNEGKVFTERNNNLIKE